MVRHGGSSRRRRCPGSSAVACLPCSTAGLAALTCKSRSPPCSAPEGGGKSASLGGQHPVFQPILPPLAPARFALAAGALVLLVVAFAHIRDGELGQPELGCEPGVVGCYLLLDALPERSTALP